MSNYKTDQENFWAGNFGDEYISRNKGELLLASNINFFCKALRTASSISECCEFGANVGMNLRALKFLYPNMKQYALEINNKAANILKEIIPEENVYQGSIIDFKPQRKWELILIKGVLIHLNPDFLNSIYETLCNSTSKYLLICEYYNPVPVKINYRGNEDKLFKRDFAGEILDTFQEFKLKD